MSNLLRAALLAGALVITPGAVLAQVSTPATPRVGTPASPVGPPAPPNAGPSAPLPNLIPRGGPLPPNLTLDQALEEAEARSPAITAAQASVAAAQGRLRQAGFGPNPELSVEVENFLGSGEVSRFRGAEVTVALSQRLDLGGRRSARRSAAQAALVAAELRVLVARADLGQQVRQQFAAALTAREQLRIATDVEERALELARVAGVLVDAGREPPLRSLRARAAAARATANRQAATATEAASRRTLAGLFGVEEPPAAVVGALNDPRFTMITPAQTLEVRLAMAELNAAEAALQQEIVARRLDPAIGIGVRHLQATNDQALVAGFSLPLPIRDRNQGGIAAARAEIDAARARVNGALATSGVRISTASANLAAADLQLRALEQAAIPESREALRLAELSYRAGKIPLIELLDAQSALAAAETDLVAARLARAQAAAELARATAQ